MNFIACCQSKRSKLLRYDSGLKGQKMVERDLTEGRSTVIPKILREMTANGSPAPEFDSDDDRSSSR